MSPHGRYPRRMSHRTATVAGLLGWRAAHRASDHLAGLFRDASRREQLAQRRHRETAERVSATLGRLRGGAAKLGQLASFLELGFIPPEYRELYQSELATLRDAAPAMDWAEVRRVLEEEWNAPPEALLEQLEHQPAAAASIGQVHRAMLPGGRRVAIKVQYPEVADALAAEVRSVSRLLPLVRTAVPAFDASVVAAELRDRVLEELDYVAEARHQARFARAYRGHPYIHVPDVHFPLTRPRVLVTDWVDGLGFRAVRELEQDARDRFGEILYRFYFGAIALLGCFNADPHPGNYMLRSDGSVAFVDFGSVKLVPPATLEVAVAMMRAGMAGDAHGVRDAMARAGFLHRPELVEPAHALRWLQLSSGWMLEGRNVTIDADVARLQLPVAGDGAFGLARRLPDVDLPPDELLFGRMRTTLVAVLAQLRATANWQAIAREWLFGEPSRTALGRAERDFLRGRPRWEAASLQPWLPGAKTS